MVAILSLAARYWFRIPAICKMEGGRTEQEYDEFEMLLGEIPSATYGNPHPEETRQKIPLKEAEKKSSLLANYTNFYHGPQVPIPSRNASFYGALSFERPSAAYVNSYQVSQGSFNEKLQTRSLDGAKITLKNGLQLPIKNVDPEDSSLPDDQSLTSALAELSFKNGVAMEATSPHLDLGSVVIPHPQSPNTLNGMNMVSLTSNGLDKYDVEIIGQESAKFLKLDVQELKKQKPGSCKPIESFSGDLVEQKQSLPVYPGSMPLAHDMQGFQVLSSVPFPGVEFPMTPYQQQYFLETQYPLPYMQAQQLRQSHITFRNMEDERYCRMHQQYIYLQRLRNQQSEAHPPIQASGNVANGLITRNLRQPYFEMPISHNLEQSNQDPFWKNTAIHSGLNRSDLIPMGNGFCHHYAQGFCGRGESCPFSHGQNRTSATSLTPHPILSTKDFDAIQILDKARKDNFPEKNLTRSQGLNSLRAIKPGFFAGNESLNHNSKGRLFSNGNFQNNPSILTAGSFQLEGRGLQGSSPDTTDLRHDNMGSQSLKYNSVDEVKGRIYLMARDQHGCRFLQRKFTEGTSEDIEKIFIEIIGQIVELMMDPFGNYLVQKLLEVCDEDQRMQILHVITNKAVDLVRISCDMHGTRAVQKVIETLKTPEQFSMVVSSLKPGTVILIKNMNGNHVAQRCLQCLMPEYSEFLFEAASAHCIELATDRYGCCVLQKCLGHSDGEQRHRLISKITSNALILSQDQYGNYVVQYVFELQVPWATVDVLDQLENNYVDLSLQKYSSNVVERCLKLAGEERRTRIIKELINNSRLDRILQDRYGNYVIQAALNHSKGTSHAALVEAIRPHVLALRNSPYGKKILSSNSLKK
ncbi:hypothetical protein HHK36_012097 [Tetracentron sinense]|uniref:Uncharacterized protein n=1 Tax=Tetracentron sinense TaxID=13715 RepID=A0A834ZJT8_TETSI|nr:hypothetical protein HHK36_012097 [Tetracentron sinense]